MTKAAVVFLLTICAMPMGAWSAGETAPFSLGVGGGLDVSTYHNEGIFDVGPAVCGFLAYTGTYPLVFRVDGRWTRIYGEHSVKSADSGPWRERDNTDFTSVRLSAVCFEKERGRAAQYAGLGVGAMRASPDDDDASWGLLLSPFAGVNLRAQTWAVSIEVGLDLALGEGASFAVIPIRVFFEL